MRAIARDARVIIMDEPTSSLTEDEADRLHDVIRSLKAQGKTVIYVSHFLDHIIANCDNVTIMRDGRVVRTVPIAGETKKSLVDSMLGQVSDILWPELPPPPDPSVPPVAELRNVGTSTGLSDISLTVRPGEIVGLVGLVGSGRTEVARAMFGADPIKTGEYYIDGKLQPRIQVMDAVAQGVALVPEDRRKQGLVLTQTVRPNISLGTLGAISRGGIISRSAEVKRVKDMIAHFGIVPAPRRWPCAALLRRQPAEGAALEMGGGEAEAPDPRRALARRRHRRPPAHPPVHRRDGAAGCRHSPHLVGARGGHQPLAPFLPPQRRPHLRRGAFDVADRRVRAPPRLPRTEPRASGGRPMTDATAKAPIVPSSRRWSLGDIAREYGVLLIIVLLLIALTLLSDSFLTPRNLLNILNQSTPLFIVSCALTLVIIGGGFDLSTGAIFGVAAVCAAWLAINVDPFVAIVAAPLIGIVLGTLNGVIITAFNVHSFLVTLATSLVYRGMAILVTDGKLIPVRTRRVRLARPPEARSRRRRRGQRRGHRHALLHGADDVHPQPHHARPRDLCGRRQRGSRAPLGHPHQPREDHHLRDLGRRCGSRRRHHRLASVDGRAAGRHRASSSKRSPR